MSALMMNPVQEHSGLMLGISHPQGKLSAKAAAFDDGWDGWDWDGWWDSDGWDGDGWDGWDGDI